MADQEKLNAVRAYLQSEFPEATIEIRPDGALRGHRFCIHRQGSAREAVLMDDFLEKFDSSELASTLAGFYLIEHLKDMQNIPILVTDRGLKLEYE